MVSETNEPADLAGFRAQREELKKERRLPGGSRQHGCPGLWPGDPDTAHSHRPDMVDRVKKCYVNFTQWITGFRRDIAELADAGKLDPRERGHDRAVRRAGE
jgi:hypothetical protein